MKHKLFSIYLLTILPTLSLAQIGSSACRASDVSAALDALLLMLPLLGKGIEAMNINTDNLTNSIKQLDLTWRTKAAEILIKYDKVVAERDELRDKLAKVENEITNQVQPVIDAAQREVDKVVEGIGNFGGSL